MPSIELVESAPIETTLDHPDIPNASEVWIEMIDGARKSLDFAQFYASGKTGSRLDPIETAIEKAAGRGVHVRFVCDEKMSSSNRDVLDRFANTKAIEVRLLPMKKLSGGVLHAKYFLVDGRETYFGSQNFDWRSLEHIQELGLRVRSIAVASAMQEVFELDWSLATVRSPAPNVAAAGSMTPPGSTPPTAKDPSAPSAAPAATNAPAPNSAPAPLSTPAQASTPAQTGAPAQTATPAHASPPAPPSATAPANTTAPASAPSPSSAPTPAGVQGTPAAGITPAGVIAPASVTAPAPASPPSPAGASAATASSSPPGPALAASATPVASALSLAGSATNTSASKEKPERFHTSTAHFPELIGGGDTALKITPVFSPKDWLPDPSSWDLPRLIEMIDAAKSTVRVQLLTYKMTGREYWAELELALRRAAARQVIVQLLVADWCQRAGTIEGLQSLELLPNFEVKLVTIPQWSGGYIPYARVVHAKYMVVDAARVWIGTSNWEKDYFYESRNVGLIVDGAAFAEKIERFFKDGWTSPYAALVDPCAMYEPPKIGD